MNRSTALSVRPGLRTGPLPAARGARPTVSVVLPACDEAAGLARVLDRLATTLRELDGTPEIIVVDDGSTDGTAAVARAAGRHFSFPVRLVQHEKNRGIGAALESGLLAALDTEGAVITMEADDTQSPDVIPRMLERLESGYDVVVGSSLAEDAAEVGVSAYRRLFARLASGALRKTTSVEGVRDVTSACRVYRAQLLARLVERYGEDGLIREDGFACLFELLLKAQAEGARITEVPLELRYDRKRSSSKIRVGRTARRYGALVWQSRVRGLRKPSQNGHRDRMHGRRERGHRNGFPANGHRDRDFASTENGARAHLSLVSEPFGPSTKQPAHRLLNIVLAAIGVVLAAPPMLMIAILVKLTSPGPILYRQTRIGLDRRTGGTRRWDDVRKVDYGGKPFTLYKFRTMYEAEGKEEQVWARPDDPRVTPVGRLLRKYRLDELPQLFNVLRGEMNIVGPRPEQPEIFHRMRSEIARYQDRQDVLPGITGWAQVNHHYDLCLDDVRQKLEYDLEYISRRSLAEDLRIMARTIPVVLRRRGGW